MENLLLLGVPILKHITVCHLQFCKNVTKVEEVTFSSGKIEELVKEMVKLSDCKCSISCVLGCTKSWPSNRFLQEVGLRLLSSTNSGRSLYVKWPVCRYGICR